MKKPLFAVLLIALLSITLLAGCSGSAQTPTQPPTEPPAEPVTEPPARSDAAPVSAPTEKPKADRISEEEARDIALSHAGLTADQVSRLRVTFDYDDGVPEYEVDFDFDGFEYDYEIHAETGKILSWDKDRDD